MPQTTIVILVTRCGCQKRFEKDGDAPPQILVPLTPHQAADWIDSRKVVAELPVRLFNLVRTVALSRSRQEAEYLEATEAPGHDPC